MQAIQLKKTDKVDLIKPLRAYIKTSFGADILESKEEALDDLQTLREEVRQGTDHTDASLQRLIRYSALVSSIDRRFPIREDNVRICFTWYNCCSNKRQSQYSASFEKVNLLFNIGALQSQLAALCNRNSEDGLKRASHFFQLAAGVFAEVNKQAAQTPQTQCLPDLSSEYLTCVQNLMLAQAQECFFDKASRGNLKPGIVSKVAAQTAQFYGVSSSLSTGNECKNMFTREVQWHLQAKTSYFNALSHFYLSNECLDNAKYGTRVAHLQVAQQHMATPTPRQLKSLPPDFQTVYENKSQQIEALLSGAKRDNDKVYHEIVPKELAAPVGAAMVQATPYQPQKLSATDDPFSSLVPFSVSQSLEQYLQLKEEIARELHSTLEDHNNIAKTCLASMNLPGAIMALDAPSGIPRELDESIQKFRSAGGVSRLNELSEMLRSLASASGDVLRDSVRMLDQEEEDDSLMRTRFGSRWGRTPSHTLTGNLRQEASKYRINFEHATKSDALVAKKKEEHRELLTRLSGTQQEVAATVPPAPPPSAADQQAVSLLKQLLRELDQLMGFREQFVYNLRQKMDNDDISTALMDSPLGQESQLQQELLKYDQDKQAANSNCEKQEALLSQISTANEQFVSRRTNSQQQLERQQAITRIKLAVDTFFEVEGNLMEGVKFYTNFQEILLKYKQKCQDFLFARQAEKQDMLNQFTSAATGFDTASSLGSAYTSPPTHSPSPTSATAFGSSLGPQQQQQYQQSHQQAQQLQQQQQQQLFQQQHQLQQHQQPQYMQQQPPQQQQQYMQQQPQQYMQQQPQQYMGQQAQPAVYMTPQGLVYAQPQQMAPGQQHQLPPGFTYKHQ